MAIRNLTDICDIQYGFAFDASGFSSVADEGMPLVRIRDVMNGRTETYFKGNYPKEYIIHKGDFLVGMDGEFNIAPWKSDDALLNQRVCRVKSNQSGVSTKFLFWFLKKELKRIEDETPFVTVKHLSAKRLKQVQLEVPPIAEQEKIVAELDCLTSIIEKKKQQLEELDKLTQSIFYDMFGDPITNEKGWTTSTLMDICDKLYAGGDVPKERFSRTKTGIYSAPILSNGKGDSAIYGYTDIPREKSPAITISGRGTIGYSRIQIEPFFPIIRLIVAVPSPHINIVFLHSHISMMPFESTGGAIPQLTVPMVKNRCIICPPLDLQNEFAQKVEAIEKQKELVKQSIVETETLFNSRMDYWFN